METMDYRTTFGLWLTIEYRMSNADTSADIDAPYCEDWYITHIGSRAIVPYEKLQWLYYKLSKTDDENLIKEKAAYLHTWG